MEDSFHFLRNVHFFDSLSDADVRKIHVVCRERRFEAGETVFYEGTLGNSFFIILEGVVEIWKGHEDTKQNRIAAFRKGQLFGELAIIDGFPRSASAIAKTPARLFSVNRDDFMRIFGNSGAISLPIMKSVSAMIRGSTESFLDDLRIRNQHLENAYRRLKKSEEQLSASLREKEILLGEIHHRVKNNMQIVSSLLSLQSRQLKDKGIQKIFRKSQNRIKAMALIHETLFRSSNLSRVDFNSYISKLTSTLLIQSADPGRSHVRLLADAEGVFLSLDDAVPVGLVINELATNALMHAFPDSGQGEIRIRMEFAEPDAEWVHLSVSDNGVGLPETVDFESTKTLGLVLVKGLVEEQLEGHLDVSRVRGTEFTIRFRQKKKS